jgi:hypothetical protein
MEELTDLVKDIGYEMNIANDFKRIHLKSTHTDLYQEDMWKELVETWKNRGYNLLQLGWSIKPTIRGAIEGAILGSIVGAVTGNDIQKYTNIGMGLGMYTELTAFIIRYDYYLFKAEFGKQPNKEE